MSALFTGCIATALQGLCGTVSPVLPYSPGNRTGHLCETMQAMPWWCHCAAALRGVDPYSAAHPTPRSCRVLSIDAWRDDGPGWTWNAWYSVGRIPEAWLALSPRRLLRALREEIGLTGQGLVALETDETNTVVVARGTRKPLYAIEHTSDHTGPPCPATVYRGGQCATWRSCFAEAHLLANYSRQIGQIG